jgi:hypothetical protein
MKKYRYDSELSWGSLSKDLQKRIIVLYNEREEQRREQEF